VTSLAYERIARADHDTVIGMLNNLSERDSAGLVQAPPGAGKSTLVRALAVTIAGRGDTVVAVGTQTNEQADDVVIALHTGNPELRIGRLHGGDGPNPAVTAAAGRSRGRLATSTSAADLLHRGAQVVVSTTRKWAYEAHPPPTFRRAPLRDAFPVLLIDESYQMRSDSLYHLPGLAPRMLCIGDPGQLDPFTTLTTTRWHGLGYSPTQPAMAILRANYPDLPIHRLHVSWRLPPSAAGIVREAFYPDVPFTAGTGRDQRQLHLTRPLRCGDESRRHADRILEQATDTGWAFAELPEQHTMRTDTEIADTISAVAGRLLERGGTIVSELPAERDGRPLTPANIAVVTAHNDQSTAVQLAMEEAGIPPGITVDTANAIQGREYAVVLAWHPLAGRRDASGFHLEAGRMCVMLSRHRHACIVVGRAGAQRLLDEYPDDTEVVLGEDGDSIDGWDANRRVLDHLLNHRV
jgi:hypothetical protein